MTRLETAMKEMTEAAGNRSCVIIVEPTSDDAAGPILYVLRNGPLWRLLGMLEYARKVVSEEES